MELLKPFKSERLFFRSLQLEDARGRYIQWLQEPLIVQYLEVRHSIPDIEKLKNYIRNMNQSANDLLLGMFMDGNDHIGNIKLGPINWKNESGIIGLLIGEKNSWNKGYATEAISAVTHYGLNELGLRKIEASCYQGNMASYRAFMKAGYRDIGLVEGIIGEKSEYENIILMSYEKLP